MGLRSRLGRLSFQQRILYSYYVVMLALMIGASAVIFVVIRNNTSARQTAGLDEIIERTIAGLDGYFQNMDNLALQVFSDPEIRQLLATANAHPAEENYFTTHAADRRRLFNRLLTINGPLSNAFRIAVFGRRGDYVDYGGFTITDHLVESRFADTSWISRVYELSGSELILPPKGDRWSSLDDFRLVSLTRALRYGETVYGFVQVDQPFPEVIDLVTIADPQISVLLADGGGEPLYHSHGKGLTIEQSIAYVDMIEAEAFRPTVVPSPITGERELVLGDRSTVTGWTYLVSVPYASVVALSKRVIFILAFAMVLVAALLYQVDYLVSRSISQPIRLLSDRLQTVRSVEPRIEFPDFRANDELQYLKESMEAMFSGLQASTQELIDSRTREINAHYEALQSQINPHFLHNLFAVMGAIARAEGSSTLVTMCREASSMFRYISKKEPSLVTIRDEIAYARNYVFLMEQRFEDGLEVEFDIDDEMLELYVPKLFLQPIIENCYAHGFKKIPQPWRIRVTGAFGPPQLNEWSGAPGQRRWLVRVEDNGSGFDSVYDGIECTAGAGCRLPDSAGGSGVGLRNIWERFCIHFKESSVLRIGNIRSNGTTSGAIVEIGGATF